MADTTPLRRTPINVTDNKLKTLETNDLKKHYIIHANGFYASHEYADLALILKTKNPGL